MTIDISFKDRNRERAMAASNERQYFIYTCLRKFSGRRVFLS